MIENIIKIIAEQGIERGFIAICFALLIGAFVILYKEYRSEKDEVRRLHSEKESLYQEMLEMASDYNKEMQNLTRETNNTITALMAMLHAMPKPNRE